MPGYLAGRAPRNKGMQYPPDPARAEEIVLVMRQAGHDRHGLRVRALIAVLWRAGLRISEALALNQTDIDERRGSLLVRHGKGDKRREAGMDQFGFEQLAAWLAHRAILPPGPCCASSTDQPAAAAGPRPLPAPNYVSSPSTPVSGAGSRPINMPTSGLCRPGVETSRKSPNQSSERSA
jgi:integrase